jgi:23S rRNA (adenine2503-C2)-methyltransferase
MFSIHDEEKIKIFFQENKIPAFRYAQIENAIYKNFVSDFDEIQTIPKDLRDRLKENCFYLSLKVEKEVTSENGQTTKILWKTHDNLFIESVIMRHLSGRNTLCISSQAGCPMACSFCATGKL